MAPLFSVILPTYNRARMVYTALSTVKWQSCGDWECWVVDDGSNDDTPRVLKEFQADARIRVLRSPANQGMNASRNQAIARAQGEFVTFLDSDDLWLPRRLDAFRARAAQSPQAGLLFSNAWVWRFARILGPLFDPARTIPEGVVPGHYGVGDRFLPYVTTNVAIRREAFTRWGLFRTEMKTLDTELFTRFLTQGLPVAALREPLSVRRIHGAQLTDHALENFRESMRALAASRASEVERREVREKVVYEVAGYLLKAAQPGQARAFLLAELGAAAKKAPLYPLTFIPAPALRTARGLRRWYLLLRHYPAWAPAQIRDVHRLIAPLLARERAERAAL